MTAPDFIVKTGDLAVFDPVFGPAVVAVAPGTISGTSRLKIDGALACIIGDEASVIVAGVAYISGVFTNPGAGILTISALGADQIAARVKSAQKYVILKGSTFMAKFSVSVPATQTTPGGPVPDAAPAYSGTGRFVTTNLRCKGS